jgi:hypothetical protein
MNPARHEKRRPDKSGRLSLDSFAHFSSHAALLRGAFAITLTTSRFLRLLRRRSALAIHRRRLRTVRSFSMTLKRWDEITFSSAHAVRRRIHGAMKVRRAAGTASAFA